VIPLLVYHAFDWLFRLTSVRILGLTENFIGLYCYSSDS
jgi:hypothetical protein